MANILEQAIAKRELNNIRTALKGAGVDISDVHTLSDAAKAIEDNLVTGPNAVVNAKLESGPGIKIVPIDKKGYRISATSDATLNADLTRELQSGTPIHKVLWSMIHKIIPDSMHQAARAQSIVDIDFYQAPYDGKDYYVNRSFQKGDGVKAGLRPNNWYLRIFTTAQKEPLYVDAGPMLEALSSDLEARIYKKTNDLVYHLFEDFKNRFELRQPRPVPGPPLPPPPPPFPWEHPHPCPPPFEPEEQTEETEETTESEETAEDTSDCPYCDVPIVNEKTVNTTADISEDSTTTDDTSSEDSAPASSIDQILFPWEDEKNLV